MYECYCFSHNVLWECKVNHFRPYHNAADAKKSVLHQAKASPNDAFVQCGTLLYINHEGVSFPEAQPHCMALALLYHNRCPAVLVLDCAILYATQGLVKLGRPWAGLLAEIVHLARVHVVEV